ncbi:MAG: HEAT repeat domain-containing protein [Ilumatobacteraceae bacterium]
MGDGDAAELRRDVVIAGHTGDVERVRAALRHDDAAVREAAFGAMARLGLFSTELASTGIGDPHPRVRGRVAELCAELPGFDLGPLLNDDDPMVVEMAAWSCGEHESPLPHIVPRLAELCTTHDEALVREAAVAALGAIGDERGLEAILRACDDKPTVRRRAVLALAPFDGPDVQAALKKALDDRDWQVRQAAEDLLG